MDGVLITFEGPEGAGKTTQIQFLENYLRDLGLPVLSLREPGGTTLGERIRSILLDPRQVISPVAEALLYAAARAQLVQQVIKPAIDQGKIVLCDRYVHASIAYQGWGRALGADVVSRINQSAVDGVLPDLIILLDISPEEGLSRVQHRQGGFDRIEREKIEFHRRVRQGYLALAEDDPGRFLVIDATQSPERIRAAIGQRVTALLRKFRITVNREGV